MSACQHVSISAAINNNRGLLRNTRRLLTNNPALLTNNPALLTNNPALLRYLEIVMGCFAQYRRTVRGTLPLGDIARRIAHLEMQFILACSTEFYVAAHHRAITGIPDGISILTSDVLRILVVKIVSHIDTSSEGIIVRREVPHRQRFLCSRIRPGTF